MGVSNVWAIFVKMMEDPFKIWHTIVYIEGLSDTTT